MFSIKCSCCCVASFGGSEMNFWMGKSKLTLQVFWGAGLNIGQGTGVLGLSCVVCEPLFCLSSWQAGRKTYAMVSGLSTGHSLASELVESNDGHEEIIKVSLTHLSFISLFFLPISTCKGTAECCQRELVVWLEGTRSEMLVLGHLLDRSFCFFFF